MEAQSGEDSSEDDSDVVMEEPYVLSPSAKKQKDNSLVTANEQSIHGSERESDHTSNSQSGDDASEGQSDHEMADLLAEDSEAEAVVETTADMGGEYESVYESHFESDAECVAEESSSGRRLGNGRRTHAQAQTQISPRNRC